MENKIYNNELLGKLQEQEIELTNDFDKLIEFYQRCSFATNYICSLPSHELDELFVKYLNWSKHKWSTYEGYDYNHLHMLLKMEIEINELKQQLCLKEIEKSNSCLISSYISTSDEPYIQLKDGDICQTPIVNKQSGEITIHTGKWDSKQNKCI